LTAPLKLRPYGAIEIRLLLLLLLNWIIIFRALTDYKITCALPAFAGLLKLIDYMLLPIKPRLYDGKKTKKIIIAVVAIVIIIIIIIVYFAEAAIHI